MVACAGAVGVGIADVSFSRGTRADGWNTMEAQHYKYVIIGGGGAGAAAAEGIRANDSAGSVLLVGQESSRPYNRPAVSNDYLRRQRGRLELATDPVGWYRDRDIDMRTGRRAALLDVARQLVSLDNGEEVLFDKLLLATGASPRPLRSIGAALPNVFYLRTLDDADRLAHAIDQARAHGRPHPGDPKKRGRAAIVGGGLLAVELAASLSRDGVHVDLLVARPYPWTKFAGETVGKLLSIHLQNNGVAVHNATHVTRLEGDGRVQRVATDSTDGALATIDADFVVVAQGVVPNRELLRGTTIAAETSILVDDHCRTSVPGIFAAGDCAAVFDPRFGKHRVLDHWESARLLGSIAGANMAGANDIALRDVGGFASEVLGLRIRSIGEPRLIDRRILRGTPTLADPDFAEIGIDKAGQVCHVLIVGESSAEPRYVSIVARRVGVNGNEAALKDASADLTDL